MKEIKKSDVLDMKMENDSKKKSYQWAYIFSWWMEGNLLLWQIWFEFGTKEM